MNNLTIFTVGLIIGISIEYAYWIHRVWKKGLLNKKDGHLMNHAEIFTQQYYLGEKLK